METELLSHKAEHKKLLSQLRLLDSKIAIAVSL
jgi:hypothetical protein